MDNMTDLTTIDQPWLHAAPLQTLLALLNEDDGEARIAGGAVRNSLLGEPISDIDIATTLVPRDVMLRLKQNGHRAIPTGIEHGTITALVDDVSFEVTTLRHDVETDGRHAKVLYGTDWEQDARRRDLTINALYLDADGKIFDPLGGIEDVLSQNIRFIDDASKRIEEDYLRILRFFRFFAWYGKFRPDADGLRACAKLKDGLTSLSAERIWHELSKLLAAPDPGRAILWMRQTGVLSIVLPESEKWGIDGFPGLIAAEQANGWEADPLLRLSAIIPPQAERIEQLSKRLKLPNKVSNRFLKWANTLVPDASLKQDPFNRWLYRQDEQAVEDRLRLALASDDDNAKKYLRQLKWLKRWERPSLPVQGRDLIENGFEPGPLISTTLLELEEKWVASDFKLDRKTLLSELQI